MPDANPDFLPATIATDLGGSDASNPVADPVAVLDTAPKSDPKYDAAPDFLPATVQHNEEFIPSTFSPQQTVTESLAGANGYSEAAQIAAQNSSNPNLHPLYVKALADMQKRQASQTPQQQAASVAKTALAIPTAAGKTVVSIITDTVPAVASNMLDILSGQPQEKTRAFGEAGAAITGAAVGAYELLRKARDTLADTSSFLKESAFGRMPLMSGEKPVQTTKSGVVLSDEEYSKRAEADILGAQTVRAAAAGEFVPALKEKAEQAGSPIRPERSEALQVAYDPTNWLPFGAGFVVGKVGPSLGLGIRTANGVEVVAKGLQTIAQVEAAANTTGVLGRSVGAVTK